MIRIWRLTKTKHLATAFSGEGAKRNGGRWNDIGVSVVYVSETLALAALETIVHVDKAARSIAYSSIEIVVPDGVVVDDVGALPANWREEPPPNETKRLGTTWATGLSSSLLKVQSVIVTTEFNYLINTIHADFAKFQIKPALDFSFDPRLWK